MRLSYSFFIIFHLLLLFSCSKSEQINSDQSYTIEIKDGVKLVHNHSPLWGEEPKVALELIRTYGSLDEQDENFQFYRLRGVARDSTGNLFILDGGNYRIQKFDENGNFLRTIGRRGQGPSEFSIPRSLEIDSQGNLYVADGTVGGLVIVLDNSGKEIRRIRTEGIKIDHFRISLSGMIGLPMIETMDVTTPIAGLYDNNFKNMVRIGEKIDLGEEEKSAYFNSAAIAFDYEEHIYLSFITQNRIDKYTLDGTLLWQSDRPLPVEPGTRKVGDEERPVTVATMVNIDYKNRIWVSTVNKPPSGVKTEDEQDESNDKWVFHILDKEGIFLGTLPTKYNITSCRIFGDRLYIIDSENLSVMEYQIVEK